MQGRAVAVPPGLDDLELAYAAGGEAAATFTTSGAFGYFGAGLSYAQRGTDGASLIDSLLLPGSGLAPGDDWRSGTVAKYVMTFRPSNVTIEKPPKGPASTIRKVMLPAGTTSFTVHAVDTPATRAGS